MQGTRMARGLRAVERALLAVGIVGIIWYGVVTATVAWYQKQAKAALDHVLTARSESAPARPPSRDDTTGLIGRLEIPRLDLSVAVLEGEDESTLGIAVGHLPDTPRPWERGNTALAGHRDTFFRPLRDIRVGDEVRLVTPHGEFRYIVRRTAIVDPEDVWVLSPLRDVGLTLITCFPFTYVGHAPQRFIVQAERLPRERVGETGETESFDTSHRFRQ